MSPRVYTVTTLLLGFMTESFHACKFPRAEPDRASRTHLHLA
jgi:hypothetical protein